jgi:hypothetical protein
VWNLTVSLLCVFGTAMSNSSSAEAVFSFPSCSPPSFFEEAVTAHWANEQKFMVLTMII